MSLTFSSNLTNKNELDLACAIKTINSEIQTLEVLKESLNETLTAALDLMQQAKGRIISGDTPQNFTKKFRFGVDSG